jgi:hypothetical protein
MDALAFAVAGLEDGESIARAVLLAMQLAEGGEEFIVRPALAIVAYGGTVASSKVAVDLVESYGPDKENIARSAASVTRKSGDARGHKRLEKVLNSADDPFLRPLLSDTVWNQLREMGSRVLTPAWSTLNELKSARDVEDAVIVAAAHPSDQFRALAYDFLRAHPQRAEVVRLLDDALEIALPESASLSAGLIRTLARTAAGGRVPDSLQRAADSGDGFVRRTALRELGGLLTDPTIDYLAKQLETEKDQAIRDSIFYSLWLGDTPKSRDLLGLHKQDSSTSEWSVKNPPLSLAYPVIG